MSEGYELIMPFLPVQSKGGPYDDTAYGAGYEMGCLDVRVAMASVFATPIIHVAIHRNNRDQADLIAMRYGYVCEVRGQDDNWVRLTLQRENQP